MPFYQNISIENNFKTNSHILAEEFILQIILDIWVLLEFCTSNFIFLKTFIRPKYFGSYYILAIHQIVYSSIHLNNHVFTEISRGSLHYCYVFSASCWPWLILTNFLFLVLLCECCRYCNFYFRRLIPSPDNILGRDLLHSTKY